MKRVIVAILLQIVHHFWGPRDSAVPLTFFETCR